MGSAQILSSSEQQVNLDDIIDHVQMAFVAWNVYPGSVTGSSHTSNVQFITRSQTNVADDVDVMHYSKVCHPCFLVLLLRFAKPFQLLVPRTTFDGCTCR
jgi:hypothetical protein